MTSILDTGLHNEVNNIRAKINQQAVRECTSELNGGRNCEIEHLIIHHPFLRLTKSSNIIGSGRRFCGPGRCCAVGRRRAR